MSADVGKCRQPSSAYMKNRKLAIFDIDGTVFRSSLLIELTDALVRDGVLPAYA
jgi:hypothetical protein